MLVNLLFLIYCHAHQLTTKLFRNSNILHSLSSNALTQTDNKIESKHLQGRIWMLYYKSRSFVFSRCVWVQTVDRVSRFLELLATSLLNGYTKDVKSSMESLSNLSICTTLAKSCSLLSWNMGYDVQKCEFLQITWALTLGR